MKDEPGFVVSTGTEIETAFEKVLHALYIYRYRVRDLAQLRLMTQIAGYLGALPQLSSTLDGAIFQSGGVIAQIGEHAVAFLMLAYQLRSPVLFRECFVHLVRNYNAYDHTPLKPVIKNLVDSARIKQVKLYNYTLVKFLTKLGRDTVLVEKAKMHHGSEHFIKILHKEALRSYRVEIPELANPVRHGKINDLRLLQACLDSLDGRDPERKMVQKCLRNELQLEKCERAELDASMGYLLSGTLPKGVLPWDLSQKFF
jgi:hypothetical protein